MRYFQITSCYGKLVGFRCQNLSVWRLGKERLIRDQRAKCRSLLCLMKKERHYLYWIMPCSMNGNEMKTSAYLL